MTSIGTLKSKGSIIPFFEPNKNAYYFDFFVFEEDFFEKCISAFDPDAFVSCCGFIVSIITESYGVFDLLDAHVLNVEYFF